MRMKARRSFVLGFVLACVTAGAIVQADPPVGTGVKITGVYINSVRSAHSSGGLNFPTGTTYSATTGRWTLPAAASTGNWTFSGNNATVSTAGPLSLGGGGIDVTPGDANASLGHGATVWNYILGSHLIAGTDLTAPSLDRGTSGTLAIGGTNATLLSLGRAGQVTKTLGPLQVTSSVDTPTSGTGLTIGGANAAGISLGRSGWFVAAQASIHANAGIISDDGSAGAPGIAFSNPLTGFYAYSGGSILGFAAASGGTMALGYNTLYTPNGVDTLSSSPMTIGTTNATAITVGGTGVTASFGGAVVAADVYANHIDIGAVAALTVGGSNASAVELGKSGALVTVKGNLKNGVSGNETATVGAAGSASALPGPPLGYLTITLSGGGTAKIPYYNP